MMRNTAFTVDNTIPYKAVTNKLQAIMNIGSSFKITVAFPLALQI